MEKQFTETFLISGKPESMVIQIYKEITNAISKGILKPGQVLKEQELQRWFGVSRAPVREAIRLLEGDGILIVNSYKKKYIRHITRQDFKDISLLLACIEGFAASLASKTITANQIADLQRINREFENAFDQKKFDLTA
jgi:DNA-binding GntR family transcriptional regulator